MEHNEIDAAAAAMRAEYSKMEGGVKLEDFARLFEVGLKAYDEFRTERQERRRGHLSWSFDEVSNED